MARERPAATSARGVIRNPQVLTQIQQQRREGITPAQTIPQILEESRAAAQVREETAAAEAAAEAQAGIPTPPRRASFVSSGAQGLNVSNFRVGGSVAVPNPATGRSRRTGPTLLGG
jgi:hypothetical protein